MPVTYGQVLYSQNEESRKQLYIIGISHKDTLTGAHGPFTPRVEAEVYRLGAWLAREKGVELLLPEGFFSRRKDALPVSRLPAGDSPGPETDVNGLEQLFSRGGEGVVNAEKLLSAHFGLPIGQVEEEDLYRTVRDGITRLSACTSLQQHFLIRSELDYHQDKRVGAMLQRIPEIVGKALHQGQIKEQKALFTIGLSHIPSILRFLREEKVAISCPLFTSSSPAEFEACSDALNLARQGFGVTILVPRVLADDPRLMRRYRLAS